VSAVLARLVAEAGAVGRVFFCDIRLAIAGGALAPAAGHARALAERVLGPIAGVETRTHAGHLLLQCVHRDGAIAQIAVRAGADDAAAIEIDGDTASLRLEENGRLVRHEAGNATVLAPPGAPLSPRALERPGSLASAPP